MNSPKISIIAAVGKNLELGKDNQLLWRIGADMKRFKDLTLGYPVIMGQKTFESIGKSLSGRKNFVLSSEEGFKAKGCVVCRSIEEALEGAKSTLAQEVFVIGGGQVYRQFLPLADKLYLTAVDATRGDADTFFPDYSTFKTTKVVGEGVSEDGVGYKFLEVTRDAKAKR